LLRALRRSFFKSLLRRFVGLWMLWAHRQAAIAERNACFRAFMTSSVAIKPRLSA